ncbi:MAG: EF-hand domain-containing protein [Pirellulales bacterium]|nr:EF-hand domain-containing protein [Pirellulales bacterium]
MRKTYLLATLAAALGCSSGPSRVQPPSIDADDAASAAMELYDKDGDGAINAAELEAAPGLKAAMTTIDANKDGSVQEDEIVARIEAWQATNIGVMAVKANFTLDGRPLSGAAVTFEPETFLGEDIKAAVGETTSGLSTVTIPKDQRPAKDTPPGLQPGLYRVRVSLKKDGQETIPAKYNSETTLGQEIAPDDPAVAGQKVRFDLKTKE